MINPNHGNQVFDVTQFGAVPDGRTNNVNAFLNAWNAACNLGSSATFLIPRGVFFVGPISFKGPCNNDQSPRVEIRGLVKAPEDPYAVKSIGWIEFRSLTGLVVTGGGMLDGQGSESWKLATAPGSNFRKNRPITLRLIKLKNSYLESLTLLNSKGFHMAVHHSDFVRLRNFRIMAPKYSPNTDGCHISGSKFIDLGDFKVGTGDDCVSVGPGSNNISITGVTCNPGHGISIGSLGKYPNEQDVVGVTVRNCTVANSDNGVRIKTWPGSQQSAARDFIFEDIIVNNVSYPIIIDQGYCSKTKCENKPASLVQISNVVFRNIRGNAMKAQGVKVQCSNSVPCKNVQLEKINLEHIDNGMRLGASTFCSNMLGGFFGEMKPNPCQL